MKSFKNISENLVALLMTFFLIGLLFLLKYQNLQEIKVIVPYTIDAVITLSE
ncbi:MAG: hypothetical protein ACPHXR_08895 [Flavicella sp.]